MLIRILQVQLLKISNLGQNIKLELLKILTLSIHNCQKKGWQGRLLLAVHIDKNGNVLNIHVKETSGLSS